MPWPKGKTNPEKSMQMRGEGNHKWNGGQYHYYHYRARELYFTGQCCLCGMTEQEHIERHGHNQGLSMHCIDGKYTKLHPNYWRTVCEFGCHQKYHKKETKNEKRN